MFSFKKRIDNAYRGAVAVPLSDASRVVIISDCHRGVANWVDDFAKNQTIYYAALKSYNRESYTYIELGDGDELWKNKRMADITTVHRDIFRLLAQFHRDDRLYMMFGNHDADKKHASGSPDLFPDAPGIRIYESLLLRYGAFDRELFLLHGHQADFFNSTLWQLARFLVRHVWKPLELIGFNDPTSAAKNNKVKEKIEKRLLSWSEERNIPVMAGHTHRPVFPEPGTGKYFNDGSCVHPFGITAIEISYGAISLVKWEQKTRDDGTVYIGKDVIGGPFRLKDYFS